MGLSSRGNDPKIRFNTCKMTSRHLSNLKPILKSLRKLWPEILRRTTSYKTGCLDKNKEEERQIAETDILKIIQKSWSEGRVKRHLMSARNYTKSTQLLPFIDQLLKFNWTMSFGQIFWSSYVKMSYVSKRLFYAV